MAERYPKRKLSTEDISRALNFDSDSDDSNDKLEKLLGEDSGSDIEFTLHMIWMCILHKFMKERNHSNVKYVMISLS